MTHLGREGHGTGRKAQENNNGSGDSMIVHRTATENTKRSAMKSAALNPILAMHAYDIVIDRRMAERACEDRKTGLNPCWILQV